MHQLGKLRGVSKGDYPEKKIDFDRERLLTDGFISHKSTVSGMFEPEPVE